MIDGRTVRYSAKKCKINKNTAFVWRHKILDALAEYQDQNLQGVIEVDDTFFRLSYKGSKPIGRKPHSRGEPASKRGVSKEQVCVSCAIDRKRRAYSKVTALGRPTAQALSVAFAQRFSNNSTLCTDKDSAYISFAAKNRFKHVQLKSGVARQGNYHVQNVNGYHSRLKHFIRQFKGVSTKYLDNYVVWNNVINEKKRDIMALLRLCFESKTKNATRWRNVSRRPAVPVIKV